MTDTAQPLAAAETVVASDPFADAANAFKTFGQPPAPDRDDKGRFAPKEQAEPAEEIEAEDAGAEPVEAVESDEAPIEADEAAEEAQPDAADMPSSWAKEDAAIWSALPPEAQAKIAEREGQRDAAINQKFQELANERKAIEPERAAYIQKRDEFIRNAEITLAVALPQEPTPEMFGAGSGHGFDQEGYVLAESQYRQRLQFVQQTAQQLDDARAQQGREAEQAQAHAMQAVEAEWQPKLVQLIPDLAAADKRGPVLDSIVQYAIKNGVPEAVFTDPRKAQLVTSPELMLAWKAMQWDKQQAARQTVTPKGAKPPSPTMRAGAQPTRSAIQNQQRNKDFDRLAKSGSVADGAAVFKHFMKG